MSSTNQVNTVTTENVVPVGATYDANGNFITLIGAAGAPIPFSGGSGSFTTLSASGTVTLSGGTANGVAYLNGSKVLTTGSALTFDGTNLGVGTSSPGASTKLNVAGRGLFTGGAADPSDSTASGVAINYDGTTGFVGAIQTGVAVRPLRIYGSSIVLAASPTATPSATLDSSGNLGLGVTPSAWGTASSRRAIELPGGGSIWGQNFGGSNPSMQVYSNAYESSTGPKYTNSSQASGYQQNAGIHAWLTAPSGTAGNAITFTQAMTLDASGNLLVGATSTVANAAFVVSKSVNDYLARFINSNSTAYGVVVNYSGVSPNSTGQEFFRCVDSTADRMLVRSNGGIANYSANNVNLSDRREKTNFAPAKSYLDVICAIPVQTFNYIDQSEDDPGLTLGVVAQDVQAVAPELVMESNWGTADDPKMRLSIYQTDLQYALMKCIQEQQALIQSLTDRISQLEAK